MTNSANQLPSHDSDAIAKANRGYFYHPTVHTPVEIECNQVVVKKEKQGEEDSKLFTLNYTASTEVLKPEIGAAKHFVQRSRMVRRLILVTPIIPISKNSFEAT